MPRGCDWLLSETSPDGVVFPETLSDEHRLIARTAAEFVTQEVLPALPAMEQKQWDVARTLVRRAGELGLIGADVPEDAGGAGLDKAASLLVGEAIGACPSFATTFGAQSGLAIIPILCFGTPDQQRAYLPRITSGEIIGAYCLSESGSGSDALAARTTAKRNSDGSWSLTGEKMWISNGGFADLFVVFAKIDGEHFTAFLVERGFPGVSTGREEHKMGLHGSSTTPLVLQEARVPAEHLLGEPGRGHKIAFNVLNYGRFKLGAMCTGGAKAALAEAIRYAAGRRQFGRPIASFGAIRHKIAEMTARIYSVESMLYRVGGLLDAVGASGGRSLAAALEELAVEASLVKVASSEATGYVVDENVQIHGGNGFVADYAAERRYRDARVNRIFEGTNEINRLVVPAQIVKRARAGAIPLFEDAGRAARHAGGPSGQPPKTGALEPAVSAIKRTAVALLREATAAAGDRLEQEQELLMLVADVVIDAFACESVALRAASAARTGHPMASLHADAASVIVHDAVLRVVATARTARASLGEGTAGDAGGDSALLAALPAVNPIAARRRLADAAAAGSRYIFSISA